MLTTTTLPSTASRVASKIGSLALNAMNAPPWMNTITGSDPVSAGVQTLTCRQSSAPMKVSPETCCEHIVPGPVASTGVVHGVGTAGGANRSAPTGGAAYGTPRNIS